jgi:AcrR family transcriptional regulator
MPGIGAAVAVRDAVAVDRVRRGMAPGEPPPDGRRRDQWMRIVRAAAELVAADAQREPRVHDIVRNARVNRNAFYEFFDSSAEAVLAAAAILSERLELATESVRSLQRTPGEALRLHIAAWLDVATQEMALLRAALCSRTSDRIEHQLERVLEGWADEAVADGALGSFPDTLRLTLAAKLTLQGALLTGERPRRDLEHTMVDAVFRLLR